MEQFYIRAFAFVGRECFAKACGVVFYECIGRFEDGLGRAVVGFKLDGFAVFKTVGKLKNVSYVCPPPAVDTLVIITHYT